MASTYNRIDARPTKEFFISMLTRDIGLQDCVLDLIDNSLHSLIREYNLDVMNVLVEKQPRHPRHKERISISFSDKQFLIEDTCGGISTSEAKNEVFRFGILKPEKKNAGLGVYGIGMKRSLFKIGKNIVIESSTKDEGFKVYIQVDEWKKKSEWEFELVPIARHQNHQTGTTIRITDLNNGVGERFKLISFKNDLIEKVARTYALFLKTGINIMINQEIVKPSLPEIVSSHDITGARKRIQCNGVEILIVAGLTPEKPPPWMVRFLQRPPCDGGR
jgi:hypothetical protein